METRSSALVGEKKKRNGPLWAGVSRGKGGEESMDVP